MTSSTSRAPGRADKLARKMVQIGFLLLFLYPFAPLIYTKLTFRPAPTFSSWLLPFDPLLMTGELVRRNGATLVIGAPLILAALTLIFGRAFCGWVCPMGTVLDLFRPIAFWQKRASLATPQGAPAKLNPFPATRNSRLRYYVLIVTVASGIFSLQFLGWLDPLVIFHRVATTFTTNALALGQPALRAYLSVVSLIFLGMLVMELGQPRFWCRHLCPLGAVISVFSRWSLLNRRVILQCNHCGDCRRICTMNAIPQEPHNTDYTDCSLCLECEAACPKRGISFGFGALAGKQWQPDQGHITLIADRCKGCGLCEAYCPRSVLAMSASFNATGYHIPQIVEAEACVVCGVCQRMCPEFAIYVTQVNETANRDDTVKPASGIPQLRGHYEAVKPGLAGLQLSRRQVIGGIAASAAGVALTPVVALTSQSKVIRPPGALPEDEFVRTCIVCQECVRVCPTGGLRPTLLEAGLAGIGTPQLLPRQGGCSLNPSCPNLCAKVCPVGAIRPTKPEDLKVGLARVDRPMCLAWDQDVKCLVCVEACLVNAAQFYNGRVTVDPERCTGCGRCESGCPVVGSAIHVEPL